MGLPLGTIADQLGTTPVDALIEIAVADGLEAGFLSAPSYREDELWEERKRAWENPFVLIGASDAGAHLDMMCGSVYTSHVLGEGVRERKLLTLEEAVSLLTRAPARLYGLHRAR